MSHRTAVVVAVAIAVVTSGGIVGVAGALPNGGDDPGTAGEAVTTAGSVQFSAQTSGGTTVTVDSVTVPEGGFVTIHDASLADGDPIGSVVGTSGYLTPGTHENVTVRLEEPLTESGTYVAMAHRDTDDDRVYDFLATNGGEDGPYTEGGGAVTADAEVTVAATVSMSDQPTDGDSVVVDRVELAAGGFVTIHDATVTEGAVFDSVRGTSEYLPAGVHENVRIELDDPVEENATLVPMAHRDTNGNQEYDFADTEGGEDGPYADDDGAIVDTAAVTLADEAQVSFDGATTGGNSVVVDEVFVPGGGFVTIHDGSVGDGAVFDSVRGTSQYLEPGFHRNVRVALDDPLSEDATLVPMAHRDTNGNEAYDFVDSEGGEDGPYTADGDAVVDQAPVTVSASVSMDVSRSDGRTVVVDSVDLAEGGFVTIHDASLSGGAVFDSVLGTSEYLEAGYHEDVVIELDERLTASQTLIPMAHRDTNDNEAYDFVDSGGDADGPYATEDGAVVDTAKTLVLASAAFESQTAEDGTVTVSEVTLQEGGFVTIHDSSLLDGDAIGSVVGTSEYLPAGTHEDVEIDVSGLEGTETLIAMPHRDTNGNEAYDFVEQEGGADGPYLGAQGAVVVAAEVEFPAAETTTATTTQAGDVETTETGDAETTAMGDVETTMDGGNGTTAEEGDGGSPGLGVVAALGALLSLLAIRRARR